MENANSKFIDKVNALRECLKEKEDLADAGLLASLDKKLRNLEEQYDEIMDRDRDLKIGIVGRVKAGKSSFLNALLFEGQDRLPKAATPMTAALTRISYTPEKAEQCAIVHYYNDGDWRLIENNANKLDEKIEAILKQEEDNRTDFRFKKMLGNQEKLKQWREKFRNEIKSNPSREIEELINCQELVSMAQKNGVSHKSLPRTADKKDEYCVALSEDKNTDFFKQLDDFVGAQGKYTAFVKYIELKINDERLSGIEVVDTPGLNDPVTSRVDVTNRFLTECDAVLLLSGVSHFLDANDADLVTRQFREASIGHAYIIGTMLDLGLMECPDRKADLQIAMNKSIESYATMAEEFLNTLEKANYTIPEGMQRKDGPFLVSSVFYSIARKMRSGEAFNEEEKHVLDMFEKKFPDYQKYLNNADDFEDLSGFEDIRENVYVPVRNNKEQILNERLATFQSQQIATIVRDIDDLVIGTERRQSLLEGNDVEELKTKQALINENLQNSKIEVRNIFDEIKYNCKKIFNDLKLNMRQAMNGFRNIHVETETKSRTWTTGIIFKDAHYELYTVRRASANEATNNIEDYGQESDRLISAAFNEMFNRDRLERRLRNAIYDTFQTAQADSSKADILGPVQALLNEIAIPEIDYSATDEAKKRIFNRFSSEVRDSDIEELKAAQSEQLEALFKDNTEKCDKALLKISDMLDKSGASFVDKICKKVNDAYDILQAQLNDKDRNIALYKDFSRDMKNMKNEFLTLED